MPQNPKNDLLLFIEDLESKQYEPQEILDEVKRKLVYEPREQREKEKEFLQGFAYKKTNNNPND